MLAAQIIRYAKRNAVILFNTSTLEQAWLASICGISEPLIQALSDAGFAKRRRKLISLVIQWPGSAWKLLNATA